MATGSVPITAGSGTPIRVLTNAGVDSGAYQQIFSLASGDGLLAPFDPDGTLQVSPEPSGLLLDDFSGTLTTNWTTGGTAPASSAGVVTTSTSTTASASSYMRTVGTFSPRSGSYLLQATLVKLETSALTNNSRWWGIGTNQTTPTAAAPVLNGAVFLLDYTNGNLYAATYSAGTRTNFVPITRPGDGQYHRYEIRYRQSIIYWIIDGVLQTTITQPNLAVMLGLPGIIGSANFTTAPSTGPALAVSSYGVSDLSATNRTISDGVNPWIQATVKQASTSVVATDLPLAVGLHPSSPLPGGTNTLGSVNLNIGQTTPFSITTTASTNASVVKASNGALLEISISNPTATAVYVKIYNKAAAPTVGTDIPVLTQRVAATGAAGDTVLLVFGALGKRLATGTAIAVTAAAAATDTAAAVAGVQISGTYI